MTAATVDYRELFERADAETKRSSEAIELQKQCIVDVINVIVKWNKAAVKLAARHKKQRSKP